MANVGLVLLAFSFVFACIASGWSSIGRFNMLALAFAFYVAAELLGGLGPHVFR